MAMLTLERKIQLVAKTYTKKCIYNGNEVDVGPFQAFDSRRDRKKENPHPGYLAYSTSR